MREDAASSHSKQQAETQEAVQNNLLIRKGPARSSNRAHGYYPSGVGVHHAEILIKQARRKVGHRENNTTLSNQEFSRALLYLRKVFESEFMNSQRLKDQIRDLNDTSRKHSKEMRRRVALDKRSNFKAWQFNLMGNVHLLQAIMRHGILNERDQKTLIDALHQVQSSVRIRFPAKQCVAFALAQVQRELTLLRGKEISCHSRTGDAASDGASRRQSRL